MNLAMSRHGFFISDSYEKDGRTILFFEYVPEELWEELKDALMRMKS